MAFYLSNDFLIKLLLFLLIFLVSWQVIRRFFNDEKISKIIALIISALAVYYMTFQQIDFLSKIYSTTGALILMLIPFVIAFFFIYLSNLGGMMRKTFWVFFFGLAFVLTQKLYLNPQAVTNISIGIVVLALIIIVFDNPIKNRFAFIRNVRRY